MAVARDLLALAKPRVISLLLVTAVAPMYITGLGAPPLSLVGWVLLGGFLMAGGANAINMWFDQDIDHFMSRTKLRPVPSGRIPPLAALAFGGAMAGVGGAYLSLVQTPFWVEKMTAGRGWIALALVVFATWKPWRVLAGAYLFGGVTLAQFQAQAMGATIPSQYLAMLPYLATVVVLAVISRDAVTIRLNAPASLGRPFHPGA